ncbi:MAG: hypothetical protein KDI36_09225 [Pseudomonadales bacterium]|nr:hypothetical protein [Pseudomonadales bacterium]
MTDNSFAGIVERDIAQPILEICKTLQREGNTDPFIFFSGIHNMLLEPDNEPMVLAAVIELSRCAFLGFQYSPEVALQIDVLLDKSINIAHTMSAGEIN